MTPADELDDLTGAAASGDAVAQRELGRLYAAGFQHPDDASVRLPCDPDKAAELLLKAIDSADGEAALLLGQLHDGEATGGVWDDPEEAFRRYRQAADLGHRPALFFVATRYLLGRGAKQDERLGAEMLLEAAYSGDTDAQAFVAAVFERHGDEVHAAAWRMVADASGSDKIDDLVGEMVPRESLDLAILLINRVGVYSRLLDTDDAVLLSAADLLRSAFASEVEALL